MEQKIELTEEVLERIARSVSNIFAGVLRNTNKVKLAEKDTSREIINLNSYMVNDAGLLILADDEIESLKQALYEAVKLYGMSDTAFAGNLILNLHRPVVKLLNKFYLEKTIENNKLAKDCDLFLKLKTIDPKYTIDDRYTGIWFSNGFDDKFVARMGITPLCNIFFDGTGFEAEERSLDDGIVSASEIYCGKVRDTKHDKTKITVLYRKVINGKEVAVTPEIFGTVYKFDNYREDENHVIEYEPVNDFLYNIGLTSLIKKSYNIEEHSRIIEAIQSLDNLTQQEFEILPITAKNAADWWATAIQTSLINYSDVSTTLEQIDKFRTLLTSNIILGVARNPIDFSITNDGMNFAFNDAKKRSGINISSSFDVGMSITPTRVILSQGKELTTLYDGNKDYDKNNTK